MWLSQLYDAVNIEQWDEFVDTDSETLTQIGRLYDVQNIPNFDLGIDLGLNAVQNIDIDLGMNSVQDEARNSF